MIDKPSSLPQVVEKVLGFNRPEVPPSPGVWWLPPVTFLQLEQVSEWGELGTLYNALIYYSY